METLKKGSRKERSVILLQALLKEGGAAVSVDGHFGAGTQRAVMAFQRQHELVVDGIAGEKTWLTLIRLYPALVERITSRYLGEKDIDRLADDLGVESAVIKAVNEVESRGAGFIVDQPKILFEGHVFWKRLRGHGLDPSDFRAGNEDILYPKWSAAHYRGGLAEYDRLARAKRIHAVAAQESASWGIFQIMGYHAEALGYGDVGRFVASMKQHERAHLKAFGAFVSVNRLLPFLENRQWAQFARAYNGPGYRKNRYDERLARAYKHYHRQAQTDAQ